MSSSQILQADNGTVKQIIQSLNNSLRTAVTNSKSVDTLMDGMVALMLKQSGWDISDPLVYEGTKDYIISVYLGRFHPTAPRHSVSASSKHGRMVRGSMPVSLHAISIRARRSRCS